MKVQIDSQLCQGHGRCYDLAPDLFGEDDEGYATLTALTADGNVPEGREGDIQAFADGFRRKLERRHVNVLAANWGGPLQSSPPRIVQ